MAATALDDDRASYASSSSLGSEDDDSDLDDVPLFVKPPPAAASTGRGLPPGFAMSLPPMRQPAAPSSKGGPPGLSLALGGVAGNNTGAGPPLTNRSPPPTRPSPATNVATPDNNLEPLPSSRTSRRPPMVGALKLPGPSPGASPSVASQHRSPNPLAPMQVPSRSSSSSGGSSGAASGGGGTAPSAPTVPAIPRLNFAAAVAASRGPTGAADASPPPTYRGSTRPSFSHTPLSTGGASAVCTDRSLSLAPSLASERDGIAPHHPHHHHQRGASVAPRMSLSGAVGGEIQVSLLSPAFCVPYDAPAPTPGNMTRRQSVAASAAVAGGIPADAAALVLERCSASLGLDAAQFQLLNVTPFHLVSGGGSGGGGAHTAPGPPRHVAVMVNSSSFSLAALEDLLTQNRQLLAAQVKNAETLSAMYNDLRALRGEHASLLTKSVQLEGQVKVVEAAKAALEVEKSSLRSKLAECDADRQHMASALHEMRRNFQEFLRLKPAAAGSGATGAGSGASPGMGGSYQHVSTANGHHGHQAHHARGEAGGGVLQHAASTPPPRTAPSRSAGNSTATTPVGTEARGGGQGGGGGGGGKASTPEHLLQSA